MKLGARAFPAVAIATVSVLGCSGAEATRPPAPNTRDTLSELLTAVNAQCPGLGGDVVGQSPGDQLFVEAVILDTSSAVAQQASLATLQSLPRMAEVQLVAAPHVIARFDQATEMASGVSDATHEQLSLVRWNVLPRHADRSAVLELELELEPPKSQHVGAPHRTVTFTASASDNEPALARVVWDEASQRSLLLLLRTFAIRDQRDLRAIFQCKMQQRALALKRSRAKP